LSKALDKTNAWLSLFNDIQKVRGQRRTASVGRSESRLSYLYEDDDSSTGSPASRPFSGQTWSTDDTSLENGLNITGVALPDLDERLTEVRQDMETQLAEQRIEYEEKLKTMENAAISSHDIEIERATMQTQLHFVQQEMKAQLESQKRQYEKRLQKARGNSSRLVFQDDESLSEQEAALAASAVEQWRKQTMISVAESLLASAVHLKEANVMSAELDKAVSFQFTVASNLPAGVQSALSQMASVEETSEGQLSLDRPTLLVRVTDQRQRSVALWPLPHFRHQLEAMRKLYAYVDKPSFSRHLSWEEPFRVADPSSYSFIGSASIALAPVNCNVAASSLAPIVCLYTHEAVGRCRVRLQPKSAVVPSSATLSPQVRKISEQRVQDGTRLTYIVIVDEFEGLGADSFSHIHCQVRSSSFIPSTLLEEITTSEELALDFRPLSKLQLYKEVSFKMTPATREHLSGAQMRVEVFGRPTSGFLDYLESWDASQTRLNRPKNMDALGRRPEVEMITEQRHDVLAHVYVCELDAEGLYKPVPVISTSSRDPGSFHLRHGLQRELIVELKHSSGRAWPWLEIDQLSVGSVRLLDAKGLVHASPTREPLSLKALDKERALYEADGSSRISFSATYDTSGHNSLFLNRITAPSTCVLVNVSWTVKGPGHEPIPFTVDVGFGKLISAFESEAHSGAVVQPRDTKAPSKLWNMFSTTRTLTSHTTLFSVALKPSNAPVSSDELWRKDTSEMYVRGEEILQKWRPHGLSLIAAFRHAVRRDGKRAQVEATRAVLEALSSTSFLSGSNGYDHDTKLRKALELWQTRPYLDKEVRLFCLSFQHGLIHSGSDQTRSNRDSKASQEAPDQE
jgi:kinesin family protein 1